MCGFAGELSGDAPCDVEAVARMAEVLAPRGPDGHGAWSDGRIALEHRRLSIIDPSPAGSQPMHDEQLGLTVVFNGCIYNHAELRGDLIKAGHAFHSTSDTEVIMRGFHEWGAQCVLRFRGMFAFAVYEQRSGRLTLARDRLGVKPLYITESGPSVRFASTLPALLAGGGVDTTIDAVALHHYLMWHSVVPAPRTILNGVRKLEPATVLTIEPSGRRTSWVYWTLRFERALEPERTWAEEVQGALRRAVIRRMVADVPVGVLLSGGLDSSLIVALLAQEGHEHLSTFSVGFAAAGGRSGDEFEYSDLIARHFGTEHHRIRVADERLLPAIPRAIAAMSEPMISHDAVAFYLLSEEVSSHVKVVQTGQGADEVFAGYSWYQPLRAARGAGLDEYVAEFFDRPHQETVELLSASHALSEDVSRAFAAEHFAAPGAATAVDRALRLDTTVMLVDDPVKRVDNMTMAWGLEARTPFLDHELVELAAACPPERKLAAGGKGVLKEAARGVVPDAVIDRPKGYFPVPALSHLEGPYLELAMDALRAPAARDRGIFREQWIDRLAAAPNDNRTTLDGNKLWQVATLELWLQAQGI
jgi:asparagine synthase (glutamine-hydrolysing)